MPSRRDQIAMTPAEVGSYLRSQRRLIVVSNGPSGFPHPMPMNFAVDEQDRLLITTFAKSQKVRNFERDPRAALLVESGELYEELKSVMIYAQAEIIHDAESVRASVIHIADQQQTPFANAPTQQTQIRASMSKRVIIRFTPDRIISWDHTKLGGVY